MSGKTSKIHCQILTPVAGVADVRAFEVVLPVYDGLMGVLPGHAPMLCNLGAGLLRLRDSEDNLRAYYIEGGFGHICDNEVSILTHLALTADDVTVADMQERLIEAQVLPSDTLEQAEARLAAIKQAKQLLILAKRENVHSR
ncbi:MAG: F0F1 ATP synthase subunit epsilon [Sedimentisphaerales bacterium]|nr:F0F1 ATP synthase subunit epsilon [Sedimentisphaerales bacterium]